MKDKKIIPDVSVPVDAGHEGGRVGVGEAEVVDPNGNAELEEVGLHVLGPEHGRVWERKQNFYETND